MLGAKAKQDMILFISVASIFNYYIFAKIYFIDTNTLMPIPLGVSFIDELPNESDNTGKETNSVVELGQGDISL